MKTRQNTPTDTKGNPNQQKDPAKGNNRGRRFTKPRPPRNFWKTMLTNKFFDLMVVIAGVSIAYYLNSLKVSADQNKLEIFYTQNLASDLDKDIEELTKNVKELQYDYQVVVSYVQEYSQGAIVGDSLASVVVAILSLDTFDGNDNTYQSLVSSNGLNTLADPEKRGLITEYYNQYKTIERFEDVYTRAIFEINDYFSPTMNYALRKISDRAVLGSERTKNSLLMAAAQLETGIENYEEALALAKTLKQTLAAKK